MTDLLQNVCPCSCCFSSPRAPSLQLPGLWAESLGRPGGTLRAHFGMNFQGKATLLEHEKPEPSPKALCSGLTAAMSTEPSLSPVLGTLVPRGQVHPCPGLCRLSPLQPATDLSSRLFNPSLTPHCYL